MDPIDAEFQYIYIYTHTHTHLKDYEHHTNTVFDTPFAFSTALILWH